MITTNRYGDTVSKWSVRWLRGPAGIKDPKKVLHSFRHAVATRLKYADVPETKIAELLGHENASVTMGRYGKKMMLSKPLEAIAQFDLRERLRGLSRHAALSDK